ncbi:Elongation factor Tu GTP binding domain [Carpediemonas membranifera]|uniref:Elongation factor Tu GTP binding domain n=1 Tax=Carpediemonas membranifera TaxID=201153 RepID=A0A8J6AQL0_9EUKA|nr:Elongation factor Tu GTP binding domain [Carpediemonas membranifera]|eukprot:KAG9391168.1 Elongation factor Tu GTP binding domain [Carpediemonas membranifera]
MLKQVPVRFGQQKKPDDIRNICIIAHVDHGKSTLTDSLISANGLMSAGMAGELRYMDNRPDEQDRGITMKSSGISLFYHKRTPGSDDAQTFMFNVVDSPGHVDFSSEVSAAIRVADGALVVVDAVEGLCVQTEAVLRQAVNEKLALTLFINKIDRLITELDMGPDEIQLQLRKVVQSVNAYLVPLIRAHPDDTVEANDVFDPEKGNVLFGSAIHGWAFSIPSMAEMWARRMGFSAAVLQKVLWGDYSFNKQKKVVKKPGAKTLFETLVLGPIFEIYDSIKSGDTDQIIKITTRLGVKVGSKEFGSAGLTKRVMSRFLPLAMTVFPTLLETVPAANQLSPDRIEHLLGSENVGPDVTGLGHHFARCDPEDPTVVAYAAKLFVHGRDIDLGESVLDRIRKFELRESADYAGDKASADSSERHMAFVRVFSGTLRVGQTLFSTGHHLPEPTEVRVGGLFAMMGKDVVPVQAVPAGLVCGVTGISHAVFKAATLASSPVAPLTPPPVMSFPVIRVAIEPAQAGDAAEVKDVLEKLQRADPTVQVKFEPSGEMVIVASGEVHLGQCLDDVRRAMGMKAVLASDPIVQFRESLAAEATYQEAVLEHEAVSFRIQLGPLDSAAIQTLEKFKARCDALDAPSVFHAGTGTTNPLPDYQGKPVIAVGPQGCGTCVLTSDVPAPAGLVKGFLAATYQGPVCQESMHGVHVHLASFSCDDEEAMTGALVGAFGQAIRRAFMDHRDQGTIRLMEPIYECGVVTSQTHLGGVHTVLAKRRAVVEFEDMLPGTMDFTVRAALPVAESFGFTTELRTRTSGAAMPQLMYRGYKVLDEDPYKKATEDELEEWGEEGFEGLVNTARRYVNSTRRRKGLFVEEVLVEDATKQRTIARKK